MGPVYSWHFCQALLCHSTAESSENLVKVAWEMNRDHFLQARTLKDKAIDLATYSVKFSLLKYDVALDLLEPASIEYNKMSSIISDFNLPKFDLNDLSLEMVEFLCR